MKQINYISVLLLILGLFGFVACKKNGNGPNPSDAVNWEIVERLQAPPTWYEWGALAIHENKPFVSAGGNEHGIPNSAFYFQLPDGWRRYTKEHQDFFCLQVFNNHLYGIMEYRVPYTTWNGVETFHYTYYLYKWTNDAFHNVATLEFTDHNSQANSPLQNPTFWQHQGQLYFVAQQSNGVSFMWNVTNDAFEQRRDIGNTGLSAVVVASAAEIAFTYYGQRHTTFEMIETLRGHYYDGNTLTTGPTHVFKSANDGSFDNTASFYVAQNGYLFGYREDLLHNFDTDSKIAQLPTALGFYSDKIAAFDGRIYSVMSDKQQSCEALGIFDGTSFRQIPYNLPEALDKCAAIISATHHQGKHYLLLASNRALYVVKEK